MSNNNSYGHPPQGPASDHFTYTPAQSASTGGHSNYPFAGSGEPASLSGYAPSDGHWSRSATDVTDKFARLAESKRTRVPAHYGSQPIQGQRQQQFLAPAHPSPATSSTHPNQWGSQPPGGNNQHLQGLPQSDNPRFGVSGIQTGQIQPPQGGYQPEHIPQVHGTIPGRPPSVSLHGQHDGSFQSGNTSQSSDASSIQAPSVGIPSTDLSVSQSASLGRADNTLYNLSNDHNLGASGLAAELAAKIREREGSVGEKPSKEVVQPPPVPIGSHPSRQPIPVPQLPHQDRLPTHTPHAPPVPDVVKPPPPPPPPPNNESLLQLWDAADDRTKLRYEGGEQEHRNSIRDQYGCH